jgi:hypothetical protein
LIEDSPNKDLIERAEDLILRLRDIQSCKIVADEEGNITEIHVVAMSDRPPKMIARDIETCLNAQLGLSIDYRKIGVVLVDPAKAIGKTSETQWREEGPRGRLEFLEQDVRIRFTGLRLSIDDDRIDVEVKLDKSGLEVVGSQGDLRHAGRLHETIAGAALHAITELLDENIRLCLSTISEVEVHGRTALLAVVDAVQGRAVTSFVGCALVGRDPNESAVLAVLDALNRPLGKWKLRTEIHYTIR